MSSESTIELKATDGGAVEVSPEMLQAFKAGFRGPVLTPDAPEYEETRKIWNAMIDRRPGLIVRCTGTADVVQAVRFAREHRLLLSVRGGGHNIAGLAVCEGGLMIDLSLMRGVWVDPARAHRARAGRLHARRRRSRDAAPRPGGGARLRLGHRHRRPHGRRRLRLPHAAPRLDLRQPGRRWRSSPPTARCVRAAADENAELFWALRGGSGNFGIVTSFEYRLFPVGPEILGGAIAWRGEDAARGARRFYREFSADGAARADLRGGAAHRAARAVAAEGDPRQADRRGVRLPQRPASRTARSCSRRCARSASRWPTSSRAGPTRRCRACSTPPSPRGGATTGSRTTWRASSRRLIDAGHRARRRASARRTRRSCCSRSRARSTSCPPTTRRRATATPPTCSTSPARGRTPPTTRANIALGARLLRGDAPVLDRRRLHQLPDRGRRHRAHRGGVRASRPGAAGGAQAQVRSGQPVPPHEERRGLIRER